MADRNMDNTDIKHSISGVESLNPQQYYVFGLVYDSYEAKYGHIPVDFDIAISEDLESLAANISEKRQTKEYKTDTGRVVVYYHEVTGANGAVSADSNKSINNTNIKHYILITPKCSIYNFVSSLIWALGNLVGYTTLSALDWFNSVNSDYESQLAIHVMSEYFSWSVSCSILYDIDKQRGLEWEEEAKQALYSKDIETELISYARYIAICDCNSTQAKEINQKLSKVAKQLSGTWERSDKITYKAFNKLRKYIKRVVDEYDKSS